mmetsp:Transcript_22495/g.45164  ORF Transcript_22495/g.45164 Transcript_22495/m.45164 type:complete len:133 (-) Transcript_22495:537-935(-)
MKSPPEASLVPPQFMISSTPLSIHTIARALSKDFATPDSPAQEALRAQLACVKITEADAAREVGVEAEGQAEADAAEAEGPRRTEDIDKELAVAAGPSSTLELEQDPRYIQAYYIEQAVSGAESDNDRELAT